MATTRDRFLEAAKAYLEEIAPEMLARYRDFLREERREYMLPRDQEEPGVELRELYLKLSLKYHPDRNPEGTATFQAINEAYQQRDLEALRRIDDPTRTEFSLGCEGSYTLTEENVWKILAGPAYQHYHGRRPDCVNVYTRTELLERLRFYTRMYERLAEVEPEEELRVLYQNKRDKYVRWLEDPDGLRVNI